MIAARNARQHKKRGPKLWPSLESRVPGLKSEVIIDPDEDNVVLGCYIPTIW